MGIRHSRFLRRFGLSLVCLALFAMVGGHWAVFQAAAWGKMLWSYSMDAGSLRVGAEKTFSGEYPCSMCRSLAKEKKKEQNLPVLAAKKPELALHAVRGAEVLPPVFDKFCFPERAFPFRVRVEAPPVPVPISRV